MSNNFILFNIFTTNRSWDKSVVLLLRPFELLNKNHFPDNPLCRDFIIG